MKKNLLLGFFASIVLFLICYHFWTPVNFDNIKSVFIAGQNINVDIASTPATQEKGLSGRKSLDGNTGMLFVFPRPDKYNFWMKDMNFPLDMVWIDSGKKVVAVSKNVSSDSYPNLFFPPSEVSYVLELNASSAQKFGISTGTSLIF